MPSTFFGSITCFTLQELSFISFNLLGIISLNLVKVPLFWFFLLRIYTASARAIPKATWAVSWSLISNWKMLMLPNPSSQLSLLCRRAFWHPTLSQHLFQLSNRHFLQFVYWSWRCVSGAGVAALDYWKMLVLIHPHNQVLLFRGLMSNPTLCQHLLEFLHRHCLQLFYGNKRGAFRNSGLFLRCGGHWCERFSLRHLWSKNLWQDGWCWSISCAARWAFQESLIDSSSRRMQITTQACPKTAAWTKLTLVNPTVASGYVFDIRSWCRDRNG